MLVFMSIHMAAAVWVGRMEAKVPVWCVCVQYVYYSSSHDSACLSRQGVVVIINGSVNLFAAVQVQFDPQNYTVTEGDVVSITLVTNTSDYMFNFTVTLQNMDGTATSECFNGSFTRTLKFLLIQFILKYMP